MKQFKLIDCELTEHSSSNRIPKYFIGSYFQTDKTRFYLSYFDPSLDTNADQIDMKDLISLKKDSFQVCLHITHFHANLPPISITLGHFDSQRHPSEF